MPINTDTSRQQYQQYVDTNKDGAITQSEYQSMLQNASQLVADIKSGKAGSPEALQFFKDVGLITENNEVNTDFSVADLRKAYSAQQKAEIGAPDPAATKKLSSNEEFLDLIKELLALFLIIRDAHFRGDMLDLQGIRAAFEGKFAAMSEEAQTRFTGAMVSGAFSMAMGTVQLGMAGASAVSAARMGAAGQSVTPGAGSQASRTSLEAGGAGSGDVQQVGKAVQSTPANLEQNMQRIGLQNSAWQSGLQGVQQYISGAGSMVKGAFDLKADGKKLEADKQQANVEMWKASEEMDKKFIDAMIQMLGSILQVVEEARRNTSQTEMRVATA